MRRWTVATALALAMLPFVGGSAAACDPDADWCGAWWGAAALEDDPLAGSLSPEADPVIDRVDPPSAPDVDRFALAAEQGLSRVTDVYAGDRVTREGPTTRFTTDTVAFDAGTAARVVAHVGTGEVSAFDGLLANGRMALSDGRAVNGDIYRNFVWQDGSWVPDTYIFFQDDSETAAAAQPMPAPPKATPTAAPEVAPLALPAGKVPLRAVVPDIGRSLDAAPPFVPPLIEAVREIPDRAGTPPERIDAGRPRTRDVRAAIALAPQGDAIGTIEVLRGRRVRLWMVATIDGVPAEVTRWRLLSGEVSAIGPISGAGDDPFVASWPSVTRPGAPFALQMSVTVRVGDGERDVQAVVTVVVRSPALVQ